MNKIISLIAIDKVTKGQVLTNRKDFKRCMNSLRILINTSRQEMKTNPFNSEVMFKNEILDVIDTIKTEFNVTDATICGILQVNKLFIYHMRKVCDRLLRKIDRQPQSLLKDRLSYITLVKNNVLTRKEAAALSGYSYEAVSSWVRNDKLYGLHLDKAVAFRHAKI